MRQERWMFKAFRFFLHEFKNFYSCHFKSHLEGIRSKTYGQMFLLLRNIMQTHEFLLTLYSDPESPLSNTSMTSLLFFDVQN